MKILSLSGENLASLTGPLPSILPVAPWEPPACLPSLAIPGLMGARARAISGRYGWRRVAYEDPLFEW